MDEKTIPTGSKEGNFMEIYISFHSPGADSLNAERAPSDIAVS